MLKRFRRKKKPEGPVVSRSEFLMLKPVRNPSVKWKKDEKEEITLLIPLVQEAEEKKTSKKKFTLFAPTPKEKEIKLDKIGSMVWELLDGNNTVKNIADALHEKYKVMPVEAEVSLDTYFKQLSKRGLVGFILPEEIQKRVTKESEEKDVKK